MKIIKLLFLSLLIAMPVYAAKIQNGEQLIAAMYKKHNAKWYRTLTFVQKTTRFRPDGTSSVETWYEAMSAPGKLRIDFAPLEKGNGLMFVDGNQHSFRDGKLANSQPSVHPLMVLGFDVYLQPVDKTINQLKELKMDLSLLREDSWQGKPVYVVGAKQGDLRSPQFWIDKKNLLFVRLLQPTGKDKTSFQEILFNKYQKVKGGGWIAPEVIFNVDNKMVLLEEYSNMQAGISLNSDLFDPQKWMTVDRNYYKKK